MIQVIYDAKNQLVDCEFGHDRNQTKLFLMNIKRELNSLVSTSNVSVQSLEGMPLPKEFQWMDYSYLRQICRKKHQEMKNKLYTKKMNNRNER